MKTIVFAQLLIAAHVTAYIPAIPTNDTNAVNQTDMSRLTMKWAPASIYSNTVSFQLARHHSRGFEQGALVHFSEKNLADQNTTTPWIALVNCDANTTDASQEDDIFTLARDRGAVGALLYSLTSEACLINPEYASPDNFEQIMDIFATQSKSSAGIINSQFMNLHNSSFSTFNAVQLNDSADSVASSLSSNNVTSSFIVATLRAANSTVSPNGTDTGLDSASSSSDGQSNNPNTGLAMIILYAITGCVSALFIVVILSGAIRAIRHPERYGPRAGGANGGPPGTIAQSRTGGIGRAILDTFPIIKFGQTTTGDNAPEPKPVDVENQTPDIEMTTRTKVADGGVEEHVESPNSGKNPMAVEPEMTAATSSSSSQHAVQIVGEAAVSSGPSTVLASAPQKSDGAQDTDDLPPDAIGHETCPICIVDFEEGDDLRVLPCEGKHRFHQACVDQWLLELSSSCPLCREDFYALEAMIAGNGPNDTGHEATTDAPASSAAGTRSSRFSKYLKFARRSHANSGSQPSESQPDLPTG